ncbi:hypothetical protein RhiirC2_791195 [Rhizophagus irregularis]|uniref:Endonuclease/exonuclease/phosphatase domain-containing protein n=1 Tax=Rhizophagus irregularis TaxID=588596 RepID=A0A2N1MJS2_9GLOM|nr:hypothetical protein RhiirC2_791195 [Rhizophagus irregularis]
MGIAPSVERFVALEGYATKSEEEWLEIIKNAGLEITKYDATISKFLGLDNPVFGAFIRGIITICIDINNVERNEEFNKHIEEFKQISNDMLEGKQREMNEMVIKMSEEWRKKEAYYFGTTNEKKNLIRTEHGMIDIEDKEKMLNYSNLSEEEFKENIRIENENVLSDYTPSTPSDTTEEDFNNTLNRRYGKTTQLNRSHTQQNTNKICRMHDQNKYRNFADLQDQSIMMAITSDHTMGGYDKTSKESIHKPKKEEDLKYFAGLLSLKIRGTEKERQLVDLFNDHKLLEYHVNTLGKMTKNGNQYTYVGFFTETAREKFIKDTRIAMEIGEFRPLQWLDKLDKMVTLSITGIDKNAHNLTEVERSIEERFGKIKEITSRTENYGKIDMKIQIELRCTEDDLMNTWGIIVNEKIIKVEPMNYKVHEIKKRGMHSATIMDIPIEIEEEDLTEQLYKTGARYWYRENNRSNDFKYSMRDRFLLGYFDIPFMGTSTAMTTIAEKGDIQMDTVMEEITRAIEEIDINSDQQESDVRYARKITIEKKNATLTETTNNNNQEDKDQMTNQFFKKINIGDSMEMITDEDTTPEDNNKASMDTTEIDSTNNMIIEIQVATITDTKDNNNNNRITPTDNVMEILTKDITDATTLTIDTDKVMIDILEVTDVTEGTQITIKQNKTFDEEGTLWGGVDNENKIEKKSIENNKKIIKNKNQRKNNVNENNKKEKNHLKIGCLNVRGLNDNKKQLDIKKIIEKENWDISLLTETKITENKGKFLYKGWTGYDIINNSFNEDNSKGGTIIKNLYNHDLYDVHEVLVGKETLDTWKSGELSSRIDYIFCNEDILKEILSYEVLDIKEELTDHKALETEDWEELAEIIEDTMINQDDQDLTRENIWNNLVLIYEREYQKIIKKKEYERKKDEEIEGLNKTQDKQKNILKKIAIYNKLAYLDNITFNIKKIIEKAKKQEWREYTRRTFSNKIHKLSEKQFSENLVINSWDTNDMGKNYATKIMRMIKDFNDKKLENERRKNENLYEEIINENIELNIKKRELDLEEDIGTMLKKILEKSRKKIDMSSLIIKENGKYTIEKNQEEIKERVYEHYKEWTRKRQIDLDLIEYEEEWRNIYSPIETINPIIYDKLTE